jgi:putative nucleotidyltransferase with HDIG domain
MSIDQQKLQQVIDVGLEITQLQDIDTLLEKTLSAARTVVNADAGTIYMKNGNRLKFGQAQNDTLQKRLPSGQKLIYRMFSLPITHHSISGYVASTGETLNIPDVYQIQPDQVPYSFDRSYDQKAHYRTQSMLTFPLKNSRRRVIGVMQLINAKNKQGEIVPFHNHDIPLVKVFVNHAAMAIERAQLKRNEILGMINFLTTLRDPEETEAHVNRVGAYSAEIYEGWAYTQGVPQAQVEKNAEILRMAAMLHDIGKLGIPQGIWEKSDTFTAEEYMMMKQHTVKGAQMLLNAAQTEYEAVAAEIALNHHEYWNGTGYPGHIKIETGQALPGYEDHQGSPRGKQGEEIPIFGRIVLIADVYDTLLHRRVFKKSLEDDVLKALEKGAGRHFDPAIISAFFSRLDTIRAITQRFPEENPSQGLDRLSAPIQHLSLNLKAKAS